MLKFITPIIGLFLIAQPVFAASPNSTSFHCSAAHANAVLQAGGSGVINSLGAAIELLGLPAVAVDGATGNAPYDDSSGLKGAWIAGEQDVSYEYDLVKNRSVNRYNDVLSNSGCFSDQTQKVLRESGSNSSGQPSSNSLKSGAAE